MDNRFKVEKVNSDKPVTNSLDNFTTTSGGHYNNACDDDAYDLQYNSLPLHERVGQLNHSDENASETLDAVTDTIKVSSTICLPDFANRRRRSLAQMTREALPRLDFYRNSRRALRRPSLGELHGEEVQTKDPNQDTEKQPPAVTGHGIKLGWIQGVLIPCLLNIWGVMLFLRLSWVVAQAGLAQSLIIIAISAIVCVITTMSLSAICTNGEVKGGGIYYIISRSLGPEFGASIGIVFAFANAVAASMNTIGFCDSLNDLLKSYDLKIVDGAVNDVRIVGAIALVIMIFICAVGMEWEAKAQNFLVAIIIAAIFDFIIGALLGPNTQEQEALGFTGFNRTVFEENWAPNYREHEHIMYNFFSVFAIFFPSVTGIQAGANISGDLKDPASSIPKGTMLSLLISMVSYIVFVIFAGGAALRDASGSVADLVAGNLTDCIPNCESGLHNSYSMMQTMSIWGGLIYAGCFAATLSTALTNLISVPRLIQALGVDKIYPGLIFFSKGYGKNGEPYRGYVLTFFVSLAFILLADLNMIAPLISNFYLASYALINFCTFHAALIKPLGWRPTFKYYNMWLSLAGFVMCVAIMFLIDWVSSLITFCVIFALYLIVIYRKPDVNWGSSTQAQTYKTALTTAQRLTNVNEHVKNYRPQILALCGKPNARPPLVDLANLITKNNSLLVCGDIVSYRLPHRMRATRIRSGYDWLRHRKVKAFYSVVDGLALEVGAKALQQSTGIGKLSPNVLMMGYKNNWGTCNTDELSAYFNILHNAFDNRLAVAILRLNNGLDVSRLTDDDEFNCTGQSSNDLTITTNNKGTNGCLANKHRVITTTNSSANMMHADSNLSISHIGMNDSISVSTDPGRTIATLNSIKNDNGSILKNKHKAAVEKILSNCPEIPKSLEQTSVFQSKQGKGNIDVWWLYDDGGLTMLLPYIISTRQDWADCKLRVFALANKKQELEVEERNMANLLAKFRIDYSSLQMVSDIMEKPKKETTDLFDSLVENFRQTQDTEENNECTISYVEECTLQEKTNRQCRLRELLLEKSSDATLVVMSLPMPRKGTVSAPLYMAWLEMLTRDMPPFLLVRGNQSSVLTFYS